MKPWTFFATLDDGRVLVARELETFGIETKDEDDLFTFYPWHRVQKVEWREA